MVAELVVEGGDLLAVLLGRDRGRERRKQQGGQRWWVDPKQWWRHFVRTCMVSFSFMRKAICTVGRVGDYERAGGRQGALLLYSSASCFRRSSNAAASACAIHNGAESLLNPSSAVRLAIKLGGSYLAICQQDILLGELPSQRFELVFFRHGGRS